MTKESVEMKGHELFNETITSSGSTQGELGLRRGWIVWTSIEYVKEAPRQSRQS